MPYASDEGGTFEVATLEAFGGVYKVEVVSDTEAECTWTARLLGTEDGM